MSGGVYVIHSAGGFVKIGISGNPARRAADLRPHQPFTVELVHVRDPGNLKARLVEAAAHHLLKDRHVRGEWFEVSTEEAIAAIEAAVTMVAAGWGPADAKPVRVSKKPVRVVSPPPPPPPPPLTPEQVHAGRIRTQLTKNDLAALAGVGAASVLRIERGHRVLPSTLTKIKAALEARGWRKP